MKLFKKQKRVPPDKEFQFLKDLRNSILSLYLFGKNQNKQIVDRDHIKLLGELNGFIMDRVGPDEVELMLKTKKAKPKFPIGTARNINTDVVKAREIMRSFYD